MNEIILLERMKSFIDEYGDIFMLSDDEHKIIIKDGEGNLFEIKITKM